MPYLFLVSYYIAIYVGYQDITERLELAELNQLSTKLYDFYILFITIVMAIVGWVMAFYGKKGQNVLWFLSLIPITYYVFGWNSEHIAYISTYGYDSFLFTLYGYIYILLALMTYAILYNNPRVVIVSAALSVIAAFLMAYYGRGSHAQITSLVGGLISEKSWEALVFSAYLELIVYFIIAIIIFVISLLLIGWIIKGRLYIKYTAKVIVINGLIVLTSLIVLMSIPFGRALHDDDILESREYLDSFTHKLEKHFDENGVYPMALPQVKGTVPRLLELHEFHDGNKEGYYLSRAEKYCFLLHDDGYPLGFYSKTSNRDWEYKLQGAIDSEEGLIALCDEGEAFSQQAIAGHLGLSSPDDNKLDLEMMIRGNISYPAMSLYISQKLDKTIKTMIDNDPDVIAERAANKANPSQIKFDDKEEVLKIINSDEFLQNSSSEQVKKLRDIVNKLYSIDGQNPEDTISAVNSLKQLLLEDK